MKTALITGCEGAIGAALVDAFSTAGYRVVGLDSAEPGRSRTHQFVQADLGQFATEVDYADEVTARIRKATQGAAISVLVNNAATQRLAAFDSLTSQDWHHTLAVNVVAPALLVRALLPDLAACRGTVVNISSIHAELTKPGFSAYATSKAALLGLTRSLAVELGGQIQVMAICPAAVQTPMLEAGFAGDEAGYRMLHELHPCGRIGRPGEVAQLVFSLADSASPFANGMVVNMDGGIGARLRDPR